MAVCLGNEMAGIGRRESIIEDLAILIEHADSSTAIYRRSALSPQGRYDTQIPFSDALHYAQLLENPYPMLIANDFCYDLRQGG